MRRIIRIPSAYFEFATSIPKSPSGKILRRLLTGRDQPAAPPAAASAGRLSVTPDAGLLGAQGRDDPVHGWPPISRLSRDSSSSPSGILRRGRELLYAGSRISLQDLFRATCLR